MSDDARYHEIRLDGVRSFRLYADEEVLAKLAPAILSDLGCSYEIRWPDRTKEDRDRREADRKAVHIRLRDDAEAYADSQIMQPAFDRLEADERDTAHDYLRRAYLAGYDRAPKTVNR